MKQPTLRDGQVPVEIRIGNVSSTRGDGWIALELTDPVSGIQFVDLEIPYEDFGKIVGSGSMAVVPGELRGLNYVGKKRVTERRDILCPLPYMTPRAELEDWLAEHGKEEGWLVSTYLGSQGSTKAEYGPPQDPEKSWDKPFLGTRLFYSVTKYVDA